MCQISLILVLTITITGGNFSKTDREFPLVLRPEWGARYADHIQMLTLPVPFVIIHHTGVVNPACSTKGECMQRMRELQNVNMDFQNMDDVAYNFVIAGDGNVYVGTSWFYTGTHTSTHNNRSIGIALLGDFMETTPPESMIELMKRVIQYGIDKEYIAGNYELKGHRVRGAVKDRNVKRRFTDTQCPGKALNQLLRTWENFKASMSELVIVSREDWHARPPTLVEPMSNPVPYVIIHHSYIPPACTTPAECVAAMQTMQDMHQITNGWNDIGYHFAVGGDGNAYQGRGWSAVGAHAPKYNNISIGICVIGDWRTELPPENQLKTVHELVEFGVNGGWISPDYTLLGHRQVRDTECPGDRLFGEVQTWEHWSEKPRRSGGKEGGSNRGDDRFFFFKEKS